MRARSNWLSHPKFKATWVAIAAGSLAGLAVLGACSDRTVSKVAGPTTISEPRLGSGVVGALSHHVQVCVDVASDPGPGGAAFTFVGVARSESAFPNPWFERDMTAAEVTAEQAYVNGFLGITSNSYGPFSAGADNDVVTAAPSTTPGNCADVLVRATFSQNAGNRMWTTASGVVNKFSSVSITANVPAGYTFTLSCVNDDSGNLQNCVNGASGYSSQNVFHGSAFVYKFTAPPPPPATCVLGYPYGTLPAKTATIFNESEVLSSFGRAGNEIRAWYTDEHALTLGVDSLFLKNKAPVVPATVWEVYPIASMGALNPSTVSSSPTPILTGSTIFAGLRAARDGFGRPLRPSMFITDLTVNGASSTIGDWQMQIVGDTGIAPNALYGTWKGAVIVIDSTKTPPQKLIKPRADPVKNHKNVGGPPAVPPPAVVQDLGFSTEIVWNISDIPGFDATHNYRLQFMVHDGDQNKTGGDVGQGCLNVGPGSPDPLVVISPAARLN